jgi:nitroreductase
MTSGWSVGYDGTPGPAWWECLEESVAAPSVHNTQPWRFRMRADGVDVFADPGRRLSVIDPRGREMLMSVGAAVLNLRIGMLARGRQPLLRLLPEADRPDLAARVTLGPPVPVSETVAALARAVPHRRTNRRPFEPVPVPADVLAELSVAARAEGGRFSVADEETRTALLSLVRTADSRRREQPAYRAELAAWVAEDPHRRDGVPPAAFGPWSALEAMPLRDFGLDHPSRRRRVGRFEDPPTLGVLSTFGDSPRDWLTAGQAMQRVLLTATVRGVSSTLMTQPTELPDLRELLGGEGGAVAHAVVRLGYGPPCSPTPRRPLAEVLVAWPARPRVTQN